MPSSKPKTAEASFRQSFARLKAGTPKVLPVGTPVSQNNVAKEAGCDPSALRKSRFPELVAEIQSYLASQDGARVPSERQRLLKQRQRSRSAKDTIKDLKAQRDHLASLLVEANARIRILTVKARDLQTKLEQLGADGHVSPMASKSKAKATPRSVDMNGDK